MAIKAVAFTGHRPDALGGYDENNPIALEVKAVLKDLIDKAYQKGFKHFITGVALGVDTWAAEILFEMRENDPEIKVYAAVPFAAQYRRWPVKSQERWKNVIEKCNQVHLVNISRVMKPDKFLESLSDLDEGAVPYWQVSRWLNERNEYMVDRASAIIAIWKGTDGGTANCVAYANKQKKPIVIYDPKTKDIKRMMNGNEV